MTEWLRQSAMGRGIFAAALLFALSVRILIPTGYMPTASAHGVVIFLCTGQGPVELTVDLGKKAPAQHQDQNSHPCTFATGLGGGLLAASLPYLLLSTVMAVPAAPGAALADFTVHRLAAPPPPSQGPPALS
ncbi:hypothetical protein [Rhizorhapis sp. SPR117]|uniref:hypothetical protein n=1 Tax=Rhizorhapis sp. SPR117 TaxID=2912611 RepID=UPI001F3E2B3F|nr:hypothetical protein [Rhizorhapis sp. SPR117]